MTFFADILALTFAAASALYAHIAGVHAKRALHNAIESAKSARRCAECVARDQEPPLDIDHAPPPRPLRLVHDEHHERLIGAAVRRHPQSSPRDEETVPPAHVDALRAPGRAPKP